MARKRKENISEVMFSYVGPDEQFNEFLKMLVHDYLSVIILNNDEQIFIIIQLRKKNERTRILILKFINNCFIIFITIFILPNI